MAASAPAPILVDVPWTPAQLLLSDVSVERLHEPRAHGRLTPCVQGRRLLLKLTSWASIPFGVDSRVYGQADRPADVGAHARGAAKLFLPLPDDLLRGFQELDERLRQLYMQGHERPSELTWTALVKKSEKQYLPGVSLKINWVGKSYTGTKPTNVRVLKPDKEVATGMGWSFIEPYLQLCDDFKQGSCLAVIEPTFFEVERKAGVTLNLVCLWLRPNRHLMLDACSCLDQVYT